MNVVTDVFTHRLYISMVQVSVSNFAFSLVNRYSSHLQCTSQFNQCCIVWSAVFPHVCQVLCVCSLCLPSSGCLLYSSSLLSFVCMFLVFAQFWVSAVFCVCRVLGMCCVPLVCRVLGVYTIAIFLALVEFQVSALCVPCVYRVMFVCCVHCVCYVLSVRCVLHVSRSRVLGVYCVFFLCLPSLYVCCVL